jgi:hypothetical protein
MPASKTLLVAGLLLAVLGTGGRRDGGGDGGESRSGPRTIAGTISGFAWAESRLTVDTPDGPVSLRVDRNTAVFLEDRLGSVRDLTVGTSVRASFAGDHRAVWLEVRSPGRVPGGPER